MGSIDSAKVIDRVSPGAQSRTATPLRKFHTGMDANTGSMRSPVVLDALKAVISQALFFDRRSRPREA